MVFFLVMDIVLVVFLMFLIEYLFGFLFFLFVRYWLKWVFMNDGWVIVEVWIEGLIVV